MLLVDAIQKKKFESLISSIKNTILDVLWYEIKEKVLFLTSNQIFILNLEAKNVECLLDIKTNDRKPFISFSFDQNRSSLLVAYDEWEGEFIERWQEDNTTGCWKLKEKLSLNLTSNEFLGKILVINEENISKIALIIYNDLYEEWRMELRDKTLRKYYKKISISKTADCQYDYKLTSIHSMSTTVKWLIYSQNTNEFLGFDSKWNQISFNHKFK